MKHTDSSYKKSRQTNCNRRHYQRFCVTTPIYLSVVGSNRTFHGQTNNLSAGGICFITQEADLKLGMLLEISIPHQQSISRKPALQSLVEIVRMTPFQETGQVTVSACMK